MFCNDKNFEKTIDREVLSSPILDLIKEKYNPEMDSDDNFNEIYDTDEFYETVRMTFDWAYEFHQKYGENNG